MKRQLADLTAPLLDVALNADEVALAQMPEDLRPEVWFASDAEDPGHARWLAIARKHGRDRKRQFVRRGCQHTADRAGNGEGKHGRKPGRIAPAARREPSPRRSPRAHAALRAGARRARNARPTGLALRAPDRVRGR